jgi:nitroreductase
MDTFEAVRTMLAVRAYEDRAVPDAVVRKIVEAAHLSPSSMNKQPWHFIVVKDKAMLRKLGELAKTGPYVAQAPLAVVVAIEKESKFAESDASRAVQNMMLTAWAEGVGSNWAGWYGLTDVAELLGVPATHQVLVIVPFGYPASTMTGRGKKQRKPLDDVMSSERFGTPFA